MPADPDTYRRLADAHPDDFRNQVFQQGVELARELLTGDAEARAMVGRIAETYEDMAANSPNEWIRRVAAQKLEELAALRAGG